MANKLSAEERQLVNHGLAEIGAPRVGAWSEGRMEEALRTLLMWDRSEEPTPLETRKATQLLLNTLPRNIISRVEEYLLLTNNVPADDNFDVYDVQPLVVVDTGTSDSNFTTNGVSKLTTSFGRGTRKKGFLVSGEKLIKNILKG